MKTHRTFRTLALLVLLLSTLSLQLSTTYAQTTFFTYQGSLTENGAPVTGLMDFEFRLYDSASAGTQQGSTWIRNEVGVTNGLFDVTLNFGSTPWNGDNRWLDIAVRAGVSEGAYTNLVPRQQITSAPYALQAVRATAVDMGTISDPSFIGTTVETPLELFVNNQRGLRLAHASDFIEESVNVIGGYSGNFVASDVIGATISGGGVANTLIPELTSTNRVLADFGTVGGGTGNTASGFHATVGGGTANMAGGSSATVGGGAANMAGGSYATIGGGNGNSATGSYATVPGGSGNTATEYAFAAGRRAKANHQGTFVWADSQNANFTSTSSNQFLIRASGGVGIGTASPGATMTISRPVQAAAHQLELRNEGSIQSPNFDGIRFTQDADGGTELASINVKYFNTGKPDLSFSVRDRPEALFIHGNYNSRGGNVGIGTNNPSQKLHVVGNILATGTITPSSDRNLKKNFHPVNPQEVLEHVAALPIQQWTYKAEEDAVRHVGPMAQDFHAAFGLGANDVTIATVDADGVALAAIQGLNQKLEQKDAEIAELKQRLERLEELLNDRLNGGAK